ncbi:uncharacterized protein LOC106672358 isoform X2 [Cimex lectularius]|uniref:Uncharacterized protein n=1 Tax=Cimex lectularius TaxID=79782 RepID=A0A8I6TK72_CIMLE|nr:uncharacterized protein LOC106672358 isoform X2 [Cimex lectularius]
MEYFLTTYSKDYKWPVPFSGVKEDKRLVNLEKQLRVQTSGGGDNDPCCIREIPPIEALEIPPAQCGVAPVGPESKFGQPNTYLRKLYNKYPYLYNILSITPPEELAKIAYADKFQTTYKADYGGEGFAPLKSFLAPEMPGEIDEDLQKAVEMDKSFQSHTTIRDTFGEVTPTESRIYTDSKTEGCQCPASQSVCTCKTHSEISHRGHAAGEDFRTNLDVTVSQAPQIPKPVSLTKIPRTPINPKKEEEDKPPEYKGGKNRPRLGKWKTEYKDTISRMGGIIIDKKLLTRWPKDDRMK